MRVPFLAVTDRPRPPRLRPPGAFLVLAACVLAALLALAGCGITTATNGGASNAPGTAASTTATATAAAAATATATATTSASASATAASRANACPGPIGSVNDAGTPALVLTPPDTTHGNSAPVGALVQVRLPDTSHWGYLSASSLTPLAPAGLHDPTHGVCVWNFRPQHTGTATLNFARSAICQPRVPCPLYVQQLSFELQVTG